MVREALLEIAVPLSDSGLSELLGARILGSQSCEELELWQADAIQGLLEEMAAQAHAGAEQGPPAFRSLGAAEEEAAAFRSLAADEPTMISDEEIARALQVEMEQESHPYPYP